MKILRHKVTGQTYPYSEFFSQHPELELVEPEVKQAAPKKTKASKPAAEDTLDDLLSGIED